MARGAEACPGQTEELAIRGHGLGAEVPVRIWSPADAEPAEPLPLLAAHDGPEYDRLAGLTRFAAAGIGVGSAAAAPRRAARPRASATSGTPPRRATPAPSCATSCPRSGAAVAVQGAPVGMGASLGALAMLHAQRRHPGTFGALFLQSGSFFTPRFDAHESRFPRYLRIVRFVRATLREGVQADPVPVVLTCGSAEENLRQQPADGARRSPTQGHPAALHEVPDLHNYTAWRDAFEPHLTSLLARAW